MEIAVNNAFFFFLEMNPEIIGRKKIPGFCPALQYSHRVRLSIHTRNVAQNPSRSRACNCHVTAVHAVSPDLEEVGPSISFKDFTVFANNFEGNAIKIRADISGEKTQVMFDDVFSKLVAAAQPIPGFRRKKGGKTPDIPKEILLQILGPSKVYKQTMKKIINATVAEYVEKEGLKVTKDLRVEQNFGELEASFIPGKEFSFDATIFQLLKSD